MKVCVGYVIKHYIMALHLEGSEISQINIECRFMADFNLRERVFDPNVCWDRKKGITNTCGELAHI